MSKTQNALQREAKADAPQKDALEVTSRGVLKKDSEDILRTDTAQKILRAFIRIDEKLNPAGK